MKKNMYKQPTTEVVALGTGYMMLDPVSFGGNNGGNVPEVHAPARGEIIP